MPATGKELILTPTLGHYHEGKVVGALQPGIAVQIDVSAGFDDQNLLSYEPYAPGTDGLRSGLIGILCPHIDGQAITTAFATGDLCRVFIPFAGCRFNGLIAAASSVGDVLIPDSGTGEWVATAGTPEIEPVQLLVATTGTDELSQCIWTGF